MLEIKYFVKCWEFFFVFHLSRNKLWLADVFGKTYLRDPNVSKLYVETNYEIAKLLIKDNTHQALLLKIFIMKLQEAYVKRVIEVFQLKPEDLDDTPEHFCEVFEFCEFLKKPTSSDMTFDSKLEDALLLV